MPLTRFGLFPPFQEKTDFLLSTNQGCESSCLSHIKATCGTTLTQDLVYGDRLSNTSECLCAQVPAGKIALDQAIGRPTDHQRIRRSQSFNARSNVGHFSQGQLFLASCSAHFTDNHQSSMDTYMNGDRIPFSCCRRVLRSPRALRILK